VGKAWSLFFTARVHSDKLQSCSQILDLNRKMPVTKH
jgi:hypothetical protein